MTLDGNVLANINYKIEVRKPKTMHCPELDTAVLEMINRLPVVANKPYLNVAYVKYYFQAKKNYIEREQK